MKIKIFRNGDESAVNEWLSANEGIEVQGIRTPTNGDLYDVVVLYKPAASYDTAKGSHSRQRKSGLGACSICGNPGAYLCGFTAGAAARPPVPQGYILCEDCCTTMRIDLIEATLIDGGVIAPC